LPWPLEYCVLDLPRILAGLLLSALIGGLAFQRGSLTHSGWLGAILTGTLTFGFGGWTWGLTLIAFFVSSSLLSRFRQAAKEQLAGEKFEKGGRRDLWQALANGGAGALFALLYGFTGAPAWLAAYAGAMATVTADTWATELGVLSPHPPRVITTLQPAAPGVSGGVSAVGTLAGAAGAIFIGGVMLLLLALEQYGWLWWVVPAALVGGVAGSLVDSVLGATLQAIYRSETGETERSTSRAGHPNRLVRGWRWMTNDGVNFLSSLAGAAVAVGVAALAGIV
jgi:uncharacterized protein (TIGR00297 family)